MRIECLLLGKSEDYRHEPGRSEQPGRGGPPSTYEAMPRGAIREMKIKPVKLKPT